MFSKTKISHHRYTGRYLPHEHTSYFGLGFLIALCTIVLAAVTFQVAAGPGYQYGDPNPGPDSGSVGLSGTVKGPPPTVGAVITSPGNGQHFSATPITVTGTCPDGTLIELFKNDIFAGATPCQSDKTFKLVIDLLYGPNNLVARDYDALDQAGPDSKTVTVFYDALPQQLSPIDSNNLNNLQILLRASPVFRGIFPGKQLEVPVEIIGGQGPYAANVDWGDNHTDLISVGNNLTFNADHTYSRPGTYVVTIKVTDAAQRSTFLTIVVIVNGKTVVSSSKQPAVATSSTALSLAWPLLVLAIAMVISYWVGERREKHKLEVAKIV